MKLSTFDLRLFQAIVDLGSISAAARRFAREKSSVSRDLARLEERLGLRLLQRTTRRLSLTEAGEILLAYARRVVEELEHAQTALDALSEVPRGMLRVTAPYAIIRFVLAPRLPTFQDRYPELAITLDPTTRVLDLVEQGIDVAIRTGELPPSSLVARKLCVSRQILVATPGYVAAHGLPRLPSDLGRHRLIDLCHGQPGAAWQLTGANGATATIAVAPRMAVPDPSLAIDLALQGLGIVAAPDLYCAAHVASGRLMRLLPDHHRGERPVQAVYPSRRQLTPKVRAFVDFAADAIGFALDEQADGKPAANRSSGPGVRSGGGSPTAGRRARPQPLKAPRWPISIQSPSPMPSGRTKGPAIRSAQSQVDRKKAKSRSARTGKRKSGTPASDRDP
jgi:DNA-binding transcriptional LysR family regulator